MKIPILDSKDFKIIKLLIEEKFIPINDLAQELNVSSRSVRNYIKRINEELENILSIETHRSKGIYISVVNKDNFSKFMEENNKQRSSLNNKEDRIKFIIDHFISIDSTETLDNLAFQMNIGKTTLVNDMKEVDKILNQYSCKIASKKNIGSYLEYNEIDLRMLMLNYCCKDYSIEMINNKYLNTSMNLIAALKTDIYTELTKNNYNVTKTILDEIIKHILIMIYRVNRGYVINHIEKKHDVVAKKKYINNYTDIVGELVEKYFNVKINTNGRLYLSIPFLTRNAAINEIYNEEHLGNFIIEIMDKIWLKINQEIGFVINDKSLLKNLAIHLNYSINRIIFNTQVQNSLAYDIKKKYKFAHRLAEIAKKIIEDELNVTVSDSETSLISIHFGALLENNKSKIDQLKNFALVCENGLGTSMLLKVRLQRILKSDCKIDVFSVYEFETMDHKDYQIVFTTLTADRDVFNKINIPIIKIDTLFNENEILNLIENSLYINNFNKNEDKYSFILPFIEDKNISFYYQINYRDILEDMLDNLINLGKVTDKFKKYILDREEVNPTIFDNGIMLPHYTSELIKNPVISLGVIKSDCIHNKKIVKIIVLIAYPKEGMIDTDMMIKIYDDILKLGQDPEIISNMVNVNTSTEIKEIIRRM